jgi:hypothetical protein
MYFDGYNSKVDIAEKLILTEEEILAKEAIKKEVIYKQIMKDIKESPFIDWIKNQMEYDNHPPGLQYKTKVFISNTEPEKKDPQPEKKDPQPEKKDPQPDSA